MGQLSVCAYDDGMAKRHDDDMVVVNHRQVHTSYLSFRTDRTTFVARVSTGEAGPGLPKISLLAESDHESHVRRILTFLQYERSDLTAYLPVAFA